MANQPNEKYSAEQVIKALQGTRGLISLAAKSLGCSAQTVRNYVQRYKTVEAALKEERERMTDVAEASLFQKVKDGEPWAVCFYLKTQGKDRGYIERSAAVNINLTADEIAKLTDDDLDKLIRQFSR